MTPENQAHIRHAMRLAAQAAQFKTLSNEIHNAIVPLEPEKYLELHRLLGELIRVTENECDRLFWLVVEADD